MAIKMAIKMASKMIERSLTDQIRVINLSNFPFERGIFEHKGVDFFLDTATRQFYSLTYLQLNFYFKLRRFGTISEY
jgi:hypothetical protein